MAWSISTHGMARIHTFEAAEEFWNNAKPWKNEDSSWRPLDDRRMQHKRLVKLSDGGYACVFYSTHIVTYYPDHVRLGFYNSISTVTFADCVHPYGCRMTSADGRQFWKVATKDGDRYYRSSNGYVGLKAVKDRLWEIDSPVDDVTEWAYDRKLGHQARKSLKPYKLWYETSERLGVSLPRHQTGVGTTNRGLHMLFEQLENVNFLDIAYLIGRPDHALKAAYKLCGAHTQQTVPSDRLPKRSRI